MSYDHAMFELHPRLNEDCITIGNFPLCRLLLMNDANYPWFILVPQREGIREIFELSEDEQKQLMDESSLFSQFIAGHFNADKINIAALGNVVPQLHIHHVVRYKDDLAWPAPIWGHAAARAYTEQGIRKLIDSLRDVLPDSFEAVQ
ncbi:MAG: HIT domain-containing protein [Mariprofundaceae bacterium]